MRCTRASGTRCPSCSVRLPAARRAPPAACPPLAATRASGSTKDDAVMFVYFGWPFALPALAYDGVLVALAGKHALSVRQLYGSGVRVRCSVLEKLARGSRTVGCSSGTPARS